MDCFYLLIKTKDGLFDEAVRRKKTQSDLTHREKHQCIKRAVAYGKKFTLWSECFISLGSNQQHTRTTAPPLLRKRIQITTRGPNPCTLPSIFNLSASSLHWANLPRCSGIAFARISMLASWYWRMSKALWRTRVNINGKKESHL